jgi:hypothetical protein
LGGIHSLAHESREHKRRYEKFKKQVELMETMKQDRASRLAKAATRLLARDA